MFGERLFACMRNWVHVWETVACIYAELGACMQDWVHVWETAGCMYAELGACMRSWVHVCGVGCLSGNRVLSQAPKLAPAPGPPPPPSTHHPGSPQSQNQDGPPQAYLSRGIPKGGLLPKGGWGRSWGIPWQTPNGGLGLELFDDCCSSAGFSPPSPHPPPLCRQQLTKPRNHETKRRNHETKWQTTRQK